MAEVTPLPTLSQTVQQLSENGDEPPHQYIWTSNIEVDARLATEIPIIDVGSIDSDLVALRSTLTTWGCFQAVNHGIESSLLDEVLRLAKEFFHQPTAEKLKCAKQGEDVEGYATATCPVLTGGVQQLEWVDRLRLLIAPYNRLRQAKERILRATAKSLKLSDEECFLRKINTMSAQFNYYPPCSKPDRVFGLRPHTDGAAVTFLLQDRQVRGLQRGVGIEAILGDLVISSCCSFSADNEQWNIQKSYA